MAAAGGLAMTRSGNHDDSYSQGLVIAFRMITVGIGITVRSYYNPETQIKADTIGWTLW